MTAQNETSAKNNDKDDVRSTEFRPHDPIDVTDQNTIFLVLEELGIAHAACVAFCAFARA